jgi:hypothetical protein
MSRVSLLSLPVLLAVGGCEAASEIAGDTLESELRSVVVAQCEEVASSAGIAAGRVSAVCQCSADKFKADTNLTIGDVSRERLQGIVEACVAQTDPDGGGR